MASKSDIEFTNLMTKLQFLSHDLVIEQIIGENHRSSILLHHKSKIAIVVLTRQIAVVNNEPNLNVQGDIPDHTFDIKQNWNKMVESPQKWFRLTETNVTKKCKKNILLITAALS